MRPTVYQVQTTPGTPVAAVTEKTGCAQIWVVNRTSQIVSFGNRDLSRTTGAGIIADVPPVSAGATPDGNIIKLETNSASENPYDLHDYLWDSATAALVNVVVWKF